MRNIAQEEKLNSPKINVNKDKKDPQLVNFNDLIGLCQLKKELQFLLDNNIKDKDKNTRVRDQEI